ncbi:hypothetical protein GTQ99_11785 [Kineococcus sp. T13]|uniref:acyl-CoA dehydrogenase family protein n=1 Tax=Kineococcus vitellinus TaxID=2696565 RepID=UPI001412FB65|nr:acyl-CoA dehydrogenase family protein [Kineococcus vitellinus]NAZ76086.1 hypothetical protein [Kineococcus vitellinus]
MRRRPVDDPAATPVAVVGDMFDLYLSDFDYDEAVVHLRTLGLRRPDLLRRYVDALESLLADPPPLDATLVWLVEGNAGTSLDEATDACALAWIRAFADDHVRPLVRELEREGRLP